MKVDPRMIEPFNAWRRHEGNHCEPSAQTVATFAAGFKAGMECAIKEATALLSGDASSKGKKGPHGG